MRLIVMMDQDSGRNILIGAAVLALVLGAIGGYFFGYSKGKSDLLAEQEAAVEAEKAAAQEELLEKVNPFDEAVNPFEGGYKNPFESANPFQ